MKVKAFQTVEQSDAVWGLDRIVPPLDTKYRYKYDGTGVISYIVDTGIRVSHVDFEGRASCGFSAYGNDDCIDTDGHGTHVAGIVGGETYGVAKNVTLVAVKVLSDGTGSIDGIVAGIDYVIGRKKNSPITPMVINMSLGGFYNSILNSAVSAAVSAGIVTVVAAGNDGRDACYYSPASAASAITVGSTTNTDTLSSFSNIGACVDILAPGSSIISTWHTSDVATTSLSGTSMASPYVAGVAVLHLQKNPSLTTSAAISAIRADALVGVIKIPWSWTKSTPNLLVTANSLLA
jgi:subtilisin family serine protease